MSSANSTYSSLLEEIKSEPIGQRILILPDTFLFKVPKHKYRVGNTYAIQHLNRKELLLIDVVHENSVESIIELLQDGYTVAALMLTHGDLVDQAYTSMKKLSEDLGGAPIFIHPLDSKKSASDLRDIIQKNEIFDRFSISVYHSPGHTGGSVMIYSEINNGMLFTGDSAVGAPYDVKGYYFERPPISDETKDQGLANTWSVFTKPFRHILPLHGKPQFALSEGEQKDIILNLSKDEPTKKL